MLRVGVGGCRNSGVDAAHAAGVIVANRALEIGDGVHDERPMAQDRRVERIAANQQHRIVIGGEDSMRKRKGISEND